MVWPYDLNQTADLSDQIYRRDNPKSPSSGWIQWKGTNVCMDIQCICGRHGHVDSDFFYTYRCGCGRLFAVGQNVRLIELTEEEAESRHEGMTRESAFEEIPEYKAGKERARRVAKAIERAEVALDLLEEKGVLDEMSPQDRRAFHYQLWLKIVERGLDPEDVALDYQTKE